MNAAGTVHQIVFRWDAHHAVGGAGVGPVAWSGSREGLEPVYRKVAPLLRVPGDEARESLARVELPRDLAPGGAVLLIRRIPDRDRGGRPSTCSHALLGSASALTPATCLGLHGWHWEGSGISLRDVEGPALDRVPPEVLRTAAERAAPALTRRTGEYAEELAAVLAGRLRHPRQRLSVLDRTGGDGPVHVLWGLRRLLGPAVPGSWSFATHDTRDGGPFRYVFVPSWPVSATRDQQLTRLDPGQPRPGGPGGEGTDGGGPGHGDAVDDAAARLVEHYLERRDDHEALRETRRALADRHVFEEERLDERVLLVHEALKWLSHAGGHRRTPADRADEEREPPRETPQDRDAGTRHEARHDEARHDDRVFDHLRQDQGRPPYRRTDEPAPAAGHAVRSGSGFPRAVTTRVLREALHQDGDGAARYLHDSTDSVLLGVLDEGLPAAHADRVAHVLAGRTGHRTASEARAVCEGVLGAHLFLGRGGGHLDEDPVTGPDSRMRVRTALLLYEHLVRPYGEEGNAPALLRRVLPDLWADHDGPGRAVLRHLLGAGRPTGFGEAGWQALFDAATRQPAREEPPVRRIIGLGAGPGHRLTGRRARAVRDPGDAAGATDDPAGRLWVTTLLGVIAVAVVLIAVLAATS